MSQGCVASRQASNERSKAQAMSMDEAEDEWEADDLVDDMFHSDCDEDTVDLVVAERQLVSAEYDFFAFLQQLITLNPSSNELFIADASSECSVCLDTGAAVQCMLQGSLPSLTAAVCRSSSHAVTRSALSVAKPGPD